MPILFLFGPLSFIIEQKLQKGARPMSDERKIVKGGFRASLALVISIIALILAVIAFERTGGKNDLNIRVQDLQRKMEEMKKETAKRVDSLREETANTLEKIGKAIKKD